MSFSSSKLIFIVILSDGNQPELVLSVLV